MAVFTCLLSNFPQRPCHLNLQLTLSQDRWHLINSKQSYWENNFNYKNVTAYAVDRSGQRSSIFINLCAKWYLFLSLIKNRKRDTTCKPSKSLSCKSWSFLALGFQWGRWRYRKSSPWDLRMFWTSYQDLNFRSTLLT